MTLQILRYQSHRETLDQGRHHRNPHEVPIQGALDLPISNAVEPQETVHTVYRVENGTIDLMTREGHLSVISETSPGPVAGMTIVHHDRHLPADFVAGEDIDPEIGHPIDMTDVIDADRDLTGKTDGIEVQVPAVEADTKANLTSHFHDVPREMCQMCR
jgi:hypothetical protein